MRSRTYTKLRVCVCVCVSFCSYLETFMIRYPTETVFFVIISHIVGGVSRFLPSYWILGTISSSSGFLRPFRLAKSVDNGERH